MVKGIDVSHWQGPTVIPEMVKQENIKYVMIRAGHGIKTDEKCESFVKQCEELGLNYGFYWYYEGQSNEAWERQTENFLYVVRKYNPTLPLAIDYEESIKFGEANQRVMQCGTTLENAGYFVVVYANKSFFNTLWNDKVKKRFAFWLADYSDTPSKGYSEKANIVIRQTSDRYKWISVDTDEFAENLLELCIKCRKGEWKILSIVLDAIKEALLNSSSAVNNFSILKDGDNYRII